VYVDGRAATLRTPPLREWTGRPTYRGVGGVFVQRDGSPAELVTVERVSRYSPAEALAYRRLWGTPAPGLADDDRPWA
jgi:hypothetical protein